ncbi:hypothetical protein ACJIZ3_019402 [Penstemon smallii]|uniref:RING-type E3 ubiquitin transferase n=1 Tax=Penstemon smallii TaxID=265156 RepID=A0ABD3T136_9LAMI
MGGLCSCFHVPDAQDNTGLNNSSSEKCYCPKCCFHKLMNKHGNVFGKQGTQVTSSSNQQAQQASSSYSSVPDENTRRSRVELEPIRQSNKNDSQKGKLGVENVTSYKFVSPDEEDVCPTCLEEYTEENPKIITKCSHHYHLSCIYEWMERSANCPICGKLMLFDE